MARIKAFRFEWTDAWHMIDDGYDSILEVSDIGDISIQFLVNTKPFKLILSEKENEFIEDFKFLAKWNDNFYYQLDVFDGTLWKFYFTYDDTSIVAKGMNGFPSDFIDFLSILHKKYGVPKAMIENEKDLLQDIKHTIIIEDSDIDSSAMYL